MTHIEANEFSPNEHDTAFPGIGNSKLLPIGAPESDHGQHVNSFLISTHMSSEDSVNF